jgi:6-pyruvoyltetrahydropterin/6-carboxytetrahydropterin synthase
LITVRHNAETAHRLPTLGGKCVNLHGHSWHLEVAVAAPALAPPGIVVDFGAFKGAFRHWVDTRMDHGAMLGYQDNLRPAFEADGTRLIVFGESGDPLTEDLPWPTVENVAVMIHRVATQCLTGLHAADAARVVGVEVRETDTNSAGWWP